jgi:hypothetical protein
MLVVKLGGEGDRYIYLLVATTTGFGGEENQRGSI